LKLVVGCAAVPDCLLKRVPALASALVDPGGRAAVSTVTMVDLASQSGSDLEAASDADATGNSAASLSTASASSATAAAPYIEGTVRAYKCLRVESEGTAKFHDCMCAVCERIPSLQDFRMRVIRQTGEVAHSSHKNFQ
jgi:hypothetical protein